MKVVAVLSPRKGSRFIKRYVENLYEVFCLDLEDQAATFKRKSPYVPPKVQNDFGRMIYVMNETGDMIAAQYSEVLGIREVAGRQWLRWEGMPYSKMKVDPKTYAPYVAYEVVPPVTEAEQLDLRLTTLIPRRRSS